MKSSQIALVAVVAGLVLGPLGVDQPGLPVTPRADEATYRTMIASLLADHDLRHDVVDSLRLFESFPFATKPRLHLASRNEVAAVSGGEMAVAVPEPPPGPAESPLHYARPALYPLVAAPLTALLGGSGPLVLNGILLSLMIVLGIRRLSAGGSEGALLTVGAFVLLSPLLPFAYLAQPEVLATTLVWLGLEGASCCRGARLEPAVRCAAGAAIALAAWLVPVAAVAALPAATWALGGKGRARHPLGLLYLLVGAALGIVVASGADQIAGAAGPLWTGPEATFLTATIENPLEPASVDPASARTVTRASGLRAALHLLWGRHAGFLVYFPMALVAGIAAFAGSFRDREQRFDTVVLVTAFAAAVAWSAIRLADANGGAADPVRDLLTAPANRVLLPLYPLFLFLLPRRPHPALAAAGGGLSAILLGTLLITPFGIPVAESTVHSHIRGWPLRLLPLELEWLDRMPDYHRYETVDGWLFMRRDEAAIDAEEVRTLGGIRTQLWLESDRPLTDGHLVLHDQAPRNRVAIGFGHDRQVVEFTDAPANGKRERLRFEPGAPRRSARVAGGERFFYPLTIETTNGARLSWRAGRPGSQYIGIGLSYLGSDDFLSQELYAAEWLGCGVPGRVTAGAELGVLARVRNRSSAPWPAFGPARVRFGARWRDDSGNEIPSAAWRADLGAHIQPGDRVGKWLHVDAPTVPGTYQLDIEMVFENVAWFSDRGSAPCTSAVDVLAADIDG